MKDGDNHQLKNGAKVLVKVGAVGALSFGVIDLVDGVDAIDDNVASSTSADSVNIASETALSEADKFGNIQTP